MASLQAVNRRILFWALQLFGWSGYALLVEMKAIFWEEHALLQLGYAALGTRHDGFAGELGRQRLLALTKHRIESNLTTSLNIGRPGLVRSPPRTATYVHHAHTRLI